MSSLTLPPLALYVHLPWCVRKCPYCDFNSYEGSGELPVEHYVDCLLADLEQHLTERLDPAPYRARLAGETAARVVSDARSVPALGSV